MPGLHSHRTSLWGLPIVEVLLNENKRSPCRNARATAIGYSRVVNEHVRTPHARYISGYTPEKSEYGQGLSGIKKRERIQGSDGEYVGIPAKVENNIHKHSCSI